jgi:hypothetical protein
MDVVRLVVEHDQVRQVLQCLERPSSQEASIQRVQCISGTRARRKRKEALDSSFPIDLSTRRLDYHLVFEEVRIFFASQQMPVGDRDHA